MVWTRIATHQFVDKETFSEWLFETALPLGGWTVETVKSADEGYYFLSKLITNASGDEIPYKLCYEHEFDEDDLTISHWDGNAAVTNTGITTLYTSSTWYPSLSTYGQAHMWKETETDAFMIYRNNSIFAFQLSSSGYLSPRGNEYTYPGTRPLWCIVPVGTFGMSDIGVMQATKMQFVGGGANVSGGDLFLYENRAYGTLYGGTSYTLPSTFWQDPTGTWKQRAQVQSNLTNNLQVAKIGKTYYINAGAFLLPVGETEPNL